MSALTLLLGSALAAPAACPVPVGIAAFEARLQAVEDDAAATAEAVPQLVDAAVAAVPCLAAPIPPRTAARLHRLVGLKASLTDELAGLPAFMAARALEPDAPLLSTIDLSDSSPGASYASVDPAQVAWDTPPPAAGATLHIDGQSPGRHSKKLPAVVQLAGSSGLRWSHYIRPGEPLPGYPMAAAPAPTPEPSPDGAGLAAAPVPQRTAAAPLRWSGAGMLAAAGALYGGSWLAHGTIANAEAGSLSAGEAASAQSLTNGLTVASGVGLGVGAGLLGASFLVGG
jgi:hypothetical protein